MYKLRKEQHPIQNHEDGILRAALPTHSTQARLTEATPGVLRLPPGSGIGPTYTGAIQARTPPSTIPRPEPNARDMDPFASRERAVKKRELELAHGLKQAAAQKSLIASLQARLRESESSNRNLKLLASLSREKDTTYLPQNQPQNTEHQNCRKQPAREDSSSIALQLSSMDSQLIHLKLATLHTAMQNLHNYVNNSTSYHQRHLDPHSQLCYHCAHCPARNSTQPPTQTQMHPLPNQMPPMATQMPPMATQVPPIPNQMPPMTTQMPPIPTQMPPRTTQMPPMPTQMPMMPTTHRQTCSHLVTTADTQPPMMPPDLYNHPCKPT